MFLRYLTQYSKPTQILYGTIGSIYGITTITSYYPKLLVENFKKEYNLSLTESKSNIEKYLKEVKDYQKIIKRNQEKVDKFTLLGLFLNFFEFFILQINIQNAKDYIAENEDLISTINKKEYFKVNNIKRPLFLIKTNNISLNIAFASVFYGTIFSLAGAFPFISTPMLVSYGFYNYYKENYNNDEIKED
jgi:hypothetical protein